MIGDGSVTERLAPSTRTYPRFELLGFKVECYQVPGCAGQVRWEISIAQQMVMSFSTLVEAVATIWEARSSNRRFTRATAPA